MQGDSDLRHCFEKATQTWSNPMLPRGPRTPPPEKKKAMRRKTFNRLLFS